MSPRLKLLLASPLIATLAACGTPTSVSTKGALDAFRTIKGSVADTCETQRQVAAHNSVYDTLKSGTETVYKAPCDVDKPAPVKLAAKT